MQEPVGGQVAERPRHGCDEDDHAARRTGPSAARSPRSPPGGSPTRTPRRGPGRQAATGDGGASRRAASAAVTPRRRRRLWAMEAPAKLDRLERVTDLVLVLLDTPQPLTLDAIAHQVPGYPSEHSARRQAFERDKRLLRDEGIPVLTQRLPGHEQYGYLIDRESFYLPELDLEPDEQVALHLAVAGVHLGDPSGRDALLKLGAAGLGDVRPIASMVPPAALIELFEAVRTRATAGFSYRAEMRRVAPVGLWFRFGHWYLVAWDLDRGAVRTFRVDRIEGEVSRGEAAERRGARGRERGRRGGSARRAVGGRRGGPDRDEDPGRCARGPPGRRRGGPGQGGAPSRRRVGRARARRLLVRRHPLLGARPPRPRHGDRTAGLPRRARRLARRRWPPPAPPLPPEASGCRRRWRTTARAGHRSGTGSAGRRDAAAGCVGFLPWWGGWPRSGRLPSPTQRAGSG